METKTETKPIELTKPVDLTKPPTPAAKPAVKPIPAKSLKETTAADLRVEVKERNQEISKQVAELRSSEKIPEPIKPSDVTPISSPSFKPGDPGVTVRSGATEVPANLRFALHAIDSAKKEWLPTLLVKLANKCMTEKVFASGGAMAEAIVGAARGK